MTCSEWLVIHRRTSDGVEMIHVVTADHSFCSNFTLIYTLYIMHYTALREQEQEQEQERGVWIMDYGLN